MFPGCPPEIHGLEQGTPDPLFHPSHFLSTDPPPAAGADPPDMATLSANLTARYRPQLTELDHILSSCGAAAPSSHPRTSIFEVPYSESSEKHDRPGDLHGPLETAGSLSENFLLEYTQGLSMQDVGWGCVTPGKLRSLMSLHTAAFDYSHRDATVARVEASNLLDHLRASMQQAVNGAAVESAPDPPGSHVLFLIGHDTNLASVAGLLHLNWLADGRRNDTPPGSALVFELWQKPHSGDSYVRVFYMAQTLEQMRSAAPLLPSNGPQRIPLRLDGCSRSSGSVCTWSAFSRLVDSVIDPADVIRNTAAAAR
jgi:4-phytase / acid phosphatase